MMCPDCDNEMEVVDTTFSTYNSGRAYKGQQTGIIYKCENCERPWLENFLNNNRLEPWHD